MLEGTEPILASYTKIFYFIYRENHNLRKNISTAGSVRLMNDTQDKEIASRWSLRDIDEAHMSYQDFLKVLDYGFTGCEGFCHSRYVCGDDCCRCIRSVFPHPKHYEQYLIAEQLKIDIAGSIKLKRIGESIGRNIS